VVDLDQEAYHEIQYKLLSLIVDNPSMITMIKDKYITEALWEEALEREPSLFREIKCPSQSLCEVICGIDGSFLKYIKKRFTYIKITRKMAHDAIASFPRAVLDVPSKLLDPRLYELALDLEPSLLTEIEPRIAEAYIQKRIHHIPEIIKYLKNPPKELIRDALIGNPNVCLYFTEVTPFMREILAQYHPQWLQLLSTPQSLPHQDVTAWGTERVTSTGEGFDGPC
jgi:hypothetical protein